MFIRPVLPANIFCHNKKQQALLFENYGIFFAKNSEPEKKCFYFRTVLLKKPE